MEDWQSGDVRAFEDLFRNYEKMVFKNAFLITGNRQDAEDVLQDVFTSVWKSRQTFDPAKGKLSTWLHRITVNECFRRRRRDRPVLPLEGMELPDRGRGVQESVEDRMEYDRLVNALETLDAKHRVVLVLRYFNDLSYEEIAKAVDAPLGTVKSRINNGLKILRKRLAETERWTTTK
jgi:RNA polymerase sigma-70 factor (ECF subfamily)